MENTVNKNGIKLNREGESITFRLAKQVVHSLREEAELKMISLNALGNKILSDYVNWYSKESDAGFITIRKETLKNLIGRVSNEEIEEIAERVSSNTAKDIMLIMRKEYSFESALDIFHTWMRVVGYVYSREVSEDGTQLLTVKHDLGIKWSKYLCSLFLNLCHEFKVKETLVDMTENTVLFKVTP